MSKASRKTEQTSSSKMPEAGDHEEANQHVNNAVLEGLFGLRTEIHSFKAEIGEMIVQKFEQFSMSIRNELTGSEE